jgi:phage terminase large subunit
MDLGRRGLFKGLLGAAGAAGVGGGGGIVEEPIRIPNWKARPYQVKLWRYLAGGGKRAVAVWHRRSGKDEIALHWAARCAMTEPGNYWHMLPEASQARKAIWDAINPHTGRRRIDEAFPMAMRKRTIENEMKIEFISGSIWQVIGSDNFNSLVGSTPRGVVFSEWAIAAPHAWAYLRPILAENHGWALFIYTPRGRNHGWSTYESAAADSEWYAERLTAEQTDVFSRETLERERAEYVRENGEDDGEALFRQEYHCDFDAPLTGSYYAKQLGELEATGHMGDFPYDKASPVYTASDIGRTDDLATWFYQKHHLRIHIIDFECEAGKDAPWFAKMLQDKPYFYYAGQPAPHTLPWDAIPKTFASPLSVVNQLHTMGVRTRIAPNLEVQDGIQALRALLPRMYFNTKNPNVARLVEALRNYQREWDDDRKVFKKTPLHNWASHPADGGRYLAVSYIEDNPSVNIGPIMRTPTLNEAWETREMGESRI